MLWILGSGAQWSELPRRYPPYQTCHRRFQNWIREEKLVELLRLLARQLHERGKLHLDQAFVDATFASAKKRLPQRGWQGYKIVAIASGDGLPIALSVESASPAECRLVEGVLAGCFLDELPETLIGEKAYDSDLLDKQLADEYRIELISPNRASRKRMTQDKRALRRYRADGRSSACSPGCKTTAGWSHDGYITSKTSSASHSSPACSFYSDIYEMAFSTLSSVVIGGRPKAQ